MTALTVTRTLNAPRERVWRAWTDADAFAGWFWPAGFEATARVELRVGGAWAIRSEKAGMGISGVFAAVEPLDRLVYSWRWDGEDEETLVTVTFSDAEEEGTKIRVLHERFGEETSAAEHEQGWSDCLDRLPAAVR